MAQETLVERHLRDGERLIGELSRAGLDISDVIPAFWAKESETGHWVFYLVSPLVNENGAVREAYRQTMPLVDMMRKNGSLIDPFDFKVIGPTDPTIRGVLAQRGFVSGGLGELDIDEAYIYPSTEKLLSDLRDAAVQLCFALKEMPWPEGMHRIDVPRQVDRLGALGQVRSALSCVGDRFGMGEFFGNLREERIKNLHLIGGPT